LRADPEQNIHDANEKAFDICKSRAVVEYASKLAEQNPFQPRRTLR
jgi:hypothetical protein